MVLWAAVVLRRNLSVHGIHDEEVGIISPEVEVVGARGEARHVEVSVNAHREVLTASVEPWTVPGGDLIATVTVTCERFNAIEGTKRARNT